MLKFEDFAHKYAGKKAVTDFQGIMNAVSEQLRKTGAGVIREAGSLLNLRVAVATLLSTPAWAETPDHMIRATNETAAQFSSAEAPKLKQENGPHRAYKVEGLNPQFRL